MSDQDLSPNENPELPAKDVGKQVDSGLETGLLSMITREDGSQKYSTVADAIKALGSSQTHIRGLEDENKLLKERLAEAEQQAQKNVAMDDILNQLNTTKDTPTEETVEQPSTPAVPQDELVNVVRSILTQEDSQRKALANQAEVDSALLSHFGDQSKAVEHCRRKAAELGLSGDDLKRTASSSPAAFLRLMDVDPSKRPELDDNINPAVNTEAQKQTQDIPARAKSVMFSGNTKDQIDEWNRVGKIVQAKMAG